MLEILIAFDPARTDAESVAIALDRLIDTALSTPDALAKCGPVEVGEFLVTQDPAGSVPAGSILI